MGPIAEQMQPLELSPLDLGTHLSGKCFLLHGCWAPELQTQVINMWGKIAVFKKSLVLLNQNLKH